MAKLDSDLLRTFLAVADAGSVTGGAKRVNKSQSAVSLQLQRLENTLGRPTFIRHGRGVELNETGRQLHSAARKIVTQIDAVHARLAGREIMGKIRFGLPDDHGRAKLAQIISSFAQDHPHVDLEVICAMGTSLPTALREGRLDLAVYEVEQPNEGEEVLFEDPTCWVSSRSRDFSGPDTTPVALFDDSCWWREAAIKGLEERGRPYRIAYSSQSVVGVMAAVEAGIGVGLVGRSSLHEGLMVVTEALGFSRPPSSKLVLRASQSVPNEPISALACAIRAAFKVR